MSVLWGAVLSVPVLIVNCPLGINEVFLGFEMNVRSNSSSFLLFFWCSLRFFRVLKSLYSLQCSEVILTLLCDAIFKKMCRSADHGFGHVTSRCSWNYAEPLQLDTLTMGSFRVDFTLCFLLSVVLSKGKISALWTRLLQTSSRGFFYLPLWLQNESNVLIAHHRLVYCFW